MCLRLFSHAVHHIELQEERVSLLNVFAHPWVSEDGDRITVHFISRWSARSWIPSVTRAGTHWHEETNDTYPDVAELAELGKRIARR